MKKKIQFILNKPQLSENVGMSLRSIGCFGFENLSLINSRKIWPNEKGLKSAKHFSFLSKKVKTYKSIPEAMKDSDILIATTVRKRDFHIPSIKLQDISKLDPNKISILLASHNMNEVSRLCKTVLMMKNGRIIDRGTPESLIDKHGRKNLEEVFLKLSRGENEFN